MPRAVLGEVRIHPAIRQTISAHHRDLVQEVEDAISGNAIVIVGMRGNPFPRKARKLLDAIGVPYKYAEYGSYLREWRRRNALKMWAGWPTLPMVFVKGMLVGGASELQALIASGDLQSMLNAPSPGGPAPAVSATAGDTDRGVSALDAAARVARDFLAAMERRDLASARQYLASDFLMCFPGGAEMRNLEELVERSSKRYQSVAKELEQVDASAGLQHTVVHCSGRLFGRWADGREFAGVRFIDRFEIVDGLIRRQDVWNDMGEVRASASVTPAGAA
ncbi:MAG: glutaredoxin domain-containing protein [Burkholderiaceae bacterium]